MSADPQIEALIEFWYSEPMRSHWYQSTPEIDQMIRDRYESLWEAASQGELDHWKATATGCLALCIILDQFPLNMFRQQAKAWSTEQQAVAVTLWARQKGLDRQLPKHRREFLYMPLMHSEKLWHQSLSVWCFWRSGLKNNAAFALHHWKIVWRFGRFPHRNQWLGRHSSAAERRYLDSDEAFKG